MILVNLPVIILTIKALKDKIVIIRRATEKDISGIINLLYQVSKVHYECRPDIFEPDTKKYSANEIKEILEDYSRPIFVAADETGEVAGYCFCVIQRNGGGVLKRFKTLYIDDLCVDESLRGKGIGGALLDYATAFAKAEKCHNITLNVWVGNDAAISFYENKGLTPQKIVLEKKL